MLISIWRFLNYLFSSPACDEGAEDTYAFKAGWRAGEELDDFIPYESGTVSFRHWKQGRSAQERQAMTVW